MRSSDSCVRAMSASASSRYRVVVPPPTSSTVAARTRQARLRSSGPTSSVPMRGLVTIASAAAKSSRSGTTVISLPLVIGRPLTACHPRHSPSVIGQLAEVIDGTDQALFERDARLPAENGPGQADIRPPDRRVVLGPVDICNGAAGTGQLHYQFGQGQH